jgi:hypothetical protein
MAQSSQKAIIMATLKPPPPDARLQALQFIPLTANGFNFLEWENDTKIALGAEEFIVYLNKVAFVGLPEVLKFQTLQILRHHIGPSLRQQYIQVEHPADLWTQLYEGFYHEQTIFLPEARNDWINLRVLDFPDLISFNAELHRITAQLRLCGETVTEAQLIDKTLSIFPPAIAILAQQYRNMRFAKHSELISHLLLAKKHQHILLKNAEARPPREIHTMISTAPSEKPQARSSTRSPAIHLSEAPRRSLRGFKRRPPPKHFKFRPKAQKLRYVPKNHKPHKQSSSTCHKCGRQGHYARGCWASPYIVEIYKELQKIHNQNRESYAVVVPSSPNTNIENYMALRTPMIQCVEAALLDNASTHTILRNL